VATPKPPPADSVKLSPLTAKPWEHAMNVIFTILFAFAIGFFVK
jgi:hypothetical protein